MKKAVFYTTQFYIFVHWLSFDDSFLFHTIYKHVTLLSRRRTLCTCSYLVHEEHHNNNNWALQATKAALLRWEKNNKSN